LQLAVLTSLWTWSRKGSLVATDDIPEALEDLKWLDIEVDEVIETGGRAAYQAIVDELLEADKAYECYCSSAELREMNATSLGSPEAIIYDGRCRSLSEDDKKALAKAGRVPRVRLQILKEPAQLLPKRLHPYIPKLVGDFVILVDGNPTTAFAAAINDKISATSHCLLHACDSTAVHQRALVLAALDAPSPEFSFIPDAMQIHGDAKRPWTTIGHLRDFGYHPLAVREVLLASSWPAPSKKSIRDHAKTFSLVKVAKADAAIDLEQLQAVNSTVLQGLPVREQVDAVVAHLERRGFTFGDRDRRWQTKFVSTLMADLNTLSDAEAMAALVLTTTVDYDRDVAEMLRDPKNQKLLDIFEKAIIKGKTKSSVDWRRTLSKYREAVQIPGRALTILRLALTGERKGPNLAYLLTLLGEDGARLRLKKARRYKS
jgi:nondiscriminating glutamyl-tRNA synthetase